VTISLSGIVLIVGNYGSGKTEVCINLAVHSKRAGAAVSVVDLDLVNPYFRAREARRLFESMEIEIILPAEHLLQADLPVLVPQVAGQITASQDLHILDVGGDDAGATVLAALADAFQAVDAPIRMLQVVNPFRPNTDTVDGCLRTRAAIEASSRRQVTGWIGNANLIEETTAAHIVFGAEFMTSLSEASGLAVEFITAPQGVLSKMDAPQLAWPVLPIQRQLVPPWAEAVAVHPALHPDSTMDHKE
jgi:hypothetical protein